MSRAPAVLQINGIMSRRCPSPPRSVYKINDIYLCTLGPSSLVNGMVQGKGAEWGSLDEHLEALGSLDYILEFEKRVVGRLCVRGVHL